MNRIFFSCIVGLLIPATPCLSQSETYQKSLKRGVGWDEKTRTLSQDDIEKMSGVSWIYNWGVAADNDLDGLKDGGEMTFVPQCWNGNFDEARLRKWLNAHPCTKYLLGFNEPNFSSQANMTPQQAAQQWPKLEKIAGDYGLQLVAPALNFSGEKVGGRTWTPYQWLDAFLEAYPNARIDALALHSYMNWWPATLWFATEYFYKDLYDPTKTDVYGKYPHLVAYFDKHGQKPMFLTEFCAWEGDKDGFVTTEESQIDQMTQKVQKLEQNPLVAGYAWFMANGNYGQYPYNSLFDDKELTPLGKVYANMSAFDTTRYYLPGEEIMAKDYVDASTDNSLLRPRPNTEAGSDVPLQVEFQNDSWGAYLIDVDEANLYQLQLRAKLPTNATLWVYIDGKSVAKANIASQSALWADYAVTLPLLQAGHHTLRIANGGKETFCLSTLKLATTDGITLPNPESQTQSETYDLAGRKSSGTRQGIVVCVEKSGDGTRRTSKLIHR